MTKLIGIKSKNKCLCLEFDMEFGEYLSCVTIFVAKLVSFQHTHRSDFKNNHDKQNNFFLKKIIITFDLVMQWITNHSFNNQNQCTPCKHQSIVRFRFSGSNRIKSEEQSQINEVVEVVNSSFHFIQMSKQIFPVRIGFLRCPKSPNVGFCLLASFQNFLQFITFRGQQERNQPKM